MSVCLTPKEIEEITGKQKYSAQFRALRKMGIDARPRADGSVFVDRRVYDAWASVPAPKRRDTAEKTQPRWGA